MSAADDALDVARFVRPGVRVEATSCLGVSGARYEGGEEWFPSHSDIAAAERVLVERGLGREYVNAMMDEYTRTAFHDQKWKDDYDAWALVAPLDARLRALARVVRENQKPKEQA